MHDNCDNNKLLVDLLKKGTNEHVECLEIGNGVNTSIWTKFDNQAKRVCEKLKAHPKFQTDEINVMGFSQGGLIARSIAQNCDIKGKVRNLMTIGSPNMGTTAPPMCANIMNGSKGKLTLDTFVKSIGCTAAKWIINTLVYYDFFQDNISPAGYWRDVDNLESYVNKASFLPLMNNEVVHPDNVKFRDRMINLNTFTAISWDSDSVIYPRESQHFDQLTSLDGKLFHFHKDNHYHYGLEIDQEQEDLNNNPDSKLREGEKKLIKKYSHPYNEPEEIRGPRKLVPLEETSWYKSDNLGLKTLNDNDRFIRLHMPGDHDKFSMDEAKEMFVPVLNL